MLYTFPAGTTFLTSPILLGSGDAGVACSEPGRTATLEWAGEGPAIVCNHDGSGFNGTIRDVTIKLKSGSSDGIRVGQNTVSGSLSAQVAVSNVAVMGASYGTHGRYGVHVVAGQICSFRDVRVYGCQVGYFFDDAAYESHAQITNTATVVSGGRVDGCVVGMRLQSAYAITLDCVTFQQNTEEAVKADPVVHGVKQLSIRDCYFETNNMNRATGPYGQVALGLGCVARIARGLFRQPNSGGNYHVLVASNVTDVDVGTDADAPFYNDQSGRNVLVVS